MMGLLWWIAVFIALGGATLGFVLLRMSSMQSRWEEDHYDHDFWQEIAGDVSDNAQGVDRDQLR